MAEIAQKGPTTEIVATDSAEIENQFLSDAQNEVIVSQSNDSVKKNARDSKKFQNRQQNLNSFEKVEQRELKVESQGTKNLSKDNQNASKSKSKNKNVETQSQNKMKQAKRRQYTLSRLSNPQNSFLRQSQKRAQMSPSIESKPKQLVDPLFLDEKIKEIAKNIRNKVKKDSSMDRHIEQINAKNVMKMKGRQPKLLPLRQSPLLVQKNKNRTINPIEILQTKLLTFEQCITIQPNPKKIVKSIITQLILQKVQKQINTRERTKSKKLKLDPINHHYPMTIFRKSIIEQIKVNTLRESLKQKERQAKLSQRREIYNSSRYQRYGKIGYFLKRDLEEHKIKGEQTVVLLSRVNPETEEGLSKMRQQTSAITQIDSLIQFVNNSDVKVQQQKQLQLARQSSCCPSLDNIRV